MRLFFALTLSDEDKISIQKWMESALPAFEKPVSMVNYHITLAFLGQVQSSQMEQITDIANSLIQPAPVTRQSLKQGLLGQHTIRMTLNQCGVWPIPHIFWIGPKQWPDAVSQLSKKLGQSCQRLGFSMDKRPYQPHVTLARKVRPPAPFPIIEPELELKIDEFSLYESVSGKSGIQYIPLQSWPLSQ